MATATTSSAATGPASVYVYSEFGTAETGTPGAYGWEGANQISGRALGGQLLMGARAYNPGTGRFSQVDPVAGGSANAYDYSLQNPGTNSDLSGDAVYKRCLQTSRWTEYCVAVYDHYSSVIYIYSLEATQRYYEWCANSFGKLPWGWAHALSEYCQGMHLYYTYKVDAAKYILTGCGGMNSSAGFYMLEGDWRFAWWFIGWHYSSWYTAWRLAVGCHG